MNKIKQSISIEREEYLKKIIKKKFSILITQINILITFLGIWEVLANKGIIDSFITSQPSRIIQTFMNLSSNDLLKHIWVTTYETIIGFLIGTILGTIIAIILWWSKFLSKVFEPYLVVLNSLPKVALRTNNHNLGWSWNPSNNCYGSCHFTYSYNFGKFKRFFRN